jgi:hypothetical protein
VPLSISAVLWRKRHKGRKVSARAALAAIFLGCGILGANGHYLPVNTFFAVPICDFAIEFDAGADFGRSLNFWVKDVSIANGAINYPSSPSFEYCVPVVIYHRALRPAHDLIWPNWSASPAKVLAPIWGECGDSLVDKVNKPPRREDLCTDCGTTTSISPCRLREDTDLEMLVPDRSVGCLVDWKAIQGYPRAVCADGFYRRVGALLGGGDRGLHFSGLNDGSYYVGVQNVWQMLTGSL